MRKGREGEWKMEWKMEKQAGAELCQAQGNLRLVGLKLDLHFL